MSILSFRNRRKYQANCRLRVGILGQRHAKMTFPPFPQMQWLWYGSLAEQWNAIHWYRRRLVANMTSTKVTMPQWQSLSGSAIVAE